MTDSEIEVADEFYCGICGGDHLERDCPEEECELCGDIDHFYEECPYYEEDGDD